jgi:hypothetical protein
MPLDFKKLRDAKKQPPVIDPVLNAWFADRAKPDHVVKLHTGAEKRSSGFSSRSRY